MHYVESQEMTFEDLKKYPDGEQLFELLAEEAGFEINKISEE